MTTTSTTSSNENNSEMEMQASEYAALQQIPGNDACIDCGRKKPDWGSPALGILMCLQCSGRHRGLGTHISFVRSVTMDAWTDKQLALMKMGGNQQCRDFLTSRGIASDATVRETYDTDAAQLYKLVLAAKVAGTTMPTQLPESMRKSAEKTAVKKKMQGFGSSPPPKPKKKRKGIRAAVMVAVPVVAAAGVWFLAA